MINTEKSDSVIIILALGMVVCVIGLICTLIEKETKSIGYWISGLATSGALFLLVLSAKMREKRFLKQKESNKPNI
jgi:hypothetical protein